MAPNSDAALDAGSIARIDQLLSSILEDRQQLGSDENGVRERIISKARELVSELETPWETVLWMIWAEPTRAVASRLALDLRVFETLVTDSGRSKTAAELAAVTGASTTLVNRITRMLASMHMVKEVGPGEYAPNRLTHALSMPKYSSGIRFCYDVPGPAFQHMPEYLKKTDYKNPDDPTDGPFQFASKSPNPFILMDKSPELLQAFHSFIHSQSEERPAWWEEAFYPVQERLVEGLELEGDSSAFVDVGGSLGQLLEGFRTAVPGYKGRLILQDLPSVIEHARSMNVDDRIELHPHDFFTEQPIKGARVYHMRYILHDWSDEFCLKIFGRLKDVMVPGYSKILINEFVVANQGAHWQPVSLDFFMMALAASHERTEGDWRGLITQAGLHVAGIWTKGIGNESIIEVTL